MNQFVGIFLLSVLVLYSTLLTGQENIQSINSVEPSFVKIRHAADITISVNNTGQNTELSILPGGTYINTQMKLPNSALKMSFSDNLLWIQSDSNTLRAYEKRFSGDFELITTIQNDAEITNFAASQGIMVFTDQSNKLTSYSTAQEITLLNKMSLLKSVTELSSHQHICLLANNQIQLLDAKTLLTLATTGSPTSTFQKIATYKNTCLSVDDNQIVQVWKQKNDELILSDSFTPNNQVNHILIEDERVILANGKTGMTILSLKNDELSWLGSYNKLGNIQLAAVSDNDLLVADDQGVLTLFDISDAKTPLLISDFKYHKDITHLEFANNQAFAISDEQLENIDFSSKSPPIISTLGVNQGGSRRSTIVDNVLYVADWFSGMHIYDISIPFSPRLLSSFHTPGSPKGVVIKDHIAFIADDDHGLQIADVSNLLKPRFISSIPLTGLAYTMKLIDQHLYIASHSGGFHIVDVADVNNPKLIGTYDTPSKSWALEYRDGLLFVADDSTGLMVFDVADPSKPKLINQFTPGGQAEDVVLKGNVAYVAFFDMGLYVLDISDPKNIQQIAHLPTPGNARGIEIHDNLLYLASWEAGVLVIDISNPSTPKTLGQYDTRGATWGLSVKNNIVYAMDWWGGVKVIDFSEAKQPALLGEYQTAGKIEDIVYSNKFIYTAHGSRGLQVYEASNSLNPVWATGKDINGYVKQLEINNDLILLAAGDGGLQIVDATNPFQIYWLSKLSLNASADLIDSLGNQVFIAEHDGDLFHINIKDPKQPILISRNKDKIKALQVTSGRLFVLSNSKTLKSFDVKNLSGHFTELQYTLPNTTSDFLIHNQVIYTIHPGNGVKAFEIKNKSLVELDSFRYEKRIQHLHIQEDKLYLTTEENELLVFNLNSNKTLQLSTTYPTVHNLERITTSNDGIFFSGENVIASGKLLPTTRVKKSTDQFILSIPSTMPLGSYHVSVSDGQNKIRKINAFTVGFPRLKSKFTLEDLKKKMQEKNFDGKAPN